MEKKLIMVFSLIMVINTTALLAGVNGIKFKEVYATDSTNGFLSSNHLITWGEYTYIVKALATQQNGNYVHRFNYMGQDTTVVLLGDVIKTGVFNNLPEVNRAEVFHPSFIASVSLVRMSAVIDMLERHFYNKELGTYIDFSIITTSQLQVLATPERILKLSSKGEKIRRSFYYNDRIRSIHTVSNIELAATGIITRDSEKDVYRGVFNPIYEIDSSKKSFLLCNLSNKIPYEFKVEQGVFSHFSPSMLDFRCASYIVINGYSGVNLKKRLKL